MKISTILAGNIFLSGAAFAAMTPYRAIVGVEMLGLSNAGFGLVMALNGIGGAMIAVLLGWISDRIPDRRVLVLLTAVLGALGLVIIWTLRTPLAFVAAFCLLVPFGNALFSQSFGYARAILNRDSPERAELSLSYLRSIFTTAWIVTPPVAGWLAAQSDSYAAFGLAAALHAGCAIIVASLWMKPSSRIGVARKENDDAEAAPPTSAHIPRAYKIGIAGVTLALVAVQLNMVLLPLMIVQDLNGTMAQVGYNASIAAAIEVPAMIGWGYLAMRVRKEIILATACLIFAAYFGLIFFATSVLQVMVLQILAAVAIAALLSINISYLQDAIKGRVGLSTSLVDVARVSSVLLASGIFALNPFADYGPMMVVAALSCILAALLMLVARRISEPSPAD